MTATSHFIRPIDHDQSADTGFPKYRAQILATQESSVFIASTIGEGGSGPELHYHLSDQIYFLLRGEMNVRLVDEVHHITPGTLIHIPAGLPHCNWNDGPGPETHLEGIIPAPSLLGAVAHMVEDGDPANVPAEHRTDRSATITKVDADIMREPFPGFRLAHLVDPSAGVERVAMYYAEVDGGKGGPGTHIHEFDQFYFVLDGELTVEVGMQKHTVGPDTLVRLPAGVPHRQYNATAEVEKHLTFLLPPPPDGVPWDFGVEVTLNGDDHIGTYGNN